MSDFQLSGLASGFDWRPVVDQLVELERVPQQRMRREKSQLESQLSNLGILENKLNTFKTAASDLTESDLFFGRKASLAKGEDSQLSIKVGDNTPTGDYSLSVTQVATRTKLTGASDVGAALDPDATLATQNVFPPVTSGSITINGVEVEIDATGSLNDVLADINAQSAEHGVTATLNGSVVELSGSGAVNLGHSSDTSNFLTSMRLFSDGSSTVSSPTLESLGALNLSTSLSKAGLSAAVSGTEGTITINGVEIEYSTGDSLNAIIERVNRSEADVTLSYDPSNDRFSLSNDASGSLGLTLEDSAGGLLAALGLTGGSTSYGQNAIFELNGGSYVSTSNTLEEATHGVEGLSITLDSSATTPFTENITVESDTKQARTKIDSFISAYNDVQDFIYEKTKVTTGDDGTVTTGVLAGNAEVEALSSQLRSMLFRSTGGTLDRLQSIGIDFASGSDKLEVKDSDALNTALAEDDQSVSELFTTAADTDDTTYSTGGLAVALKAYLTDYTSLSGSLDSQKDFLNERTSSIDAQIERQERYVQTQRDILEASFLRMEQMQAEINRQSQALSGAFG